MSQIKETVIYEEENIKALVSLIKNACVRYEQDGNNANISNIIEKSQELHTARIRYNAFSYASKVEGKEEEK